MKMEDKKSSAPFNGFNPLRSISIGMMHLETSHPVERYIFPNQDGTFAGRGINYYLSLTGGGGISTYLDFNFDIRSNTVEGFRFKKGSLSLQTESVSLEFGRNNIWLGNAHYGSLLLSNNAEPYTLIRFRTEKPFRVPYIGKFDYTLFHGWPRNFNIIGHQLSYYPVSWFEFNIKQTVTYTGTYTFNEYLKMFTGREANVPGRVGSTDSRASFEIAANLIFLSDLLPSLKNARFYMEYAGEDLYAIWQKPDKVLEKDLWVGPFGFQLLDTALSTGIRMNFENSDFIIEYAQNYKTHYLFYDPYNGGRPYNFNWYRHHSQPPFVNNNAILGHHMGTAAEMFTILLSHSFSEFNASIIASRRHRWNIGLDQIYTHKIGTAERQDSFSGIFGYNYNNFILSLIIILNSYNNLDINETPVLNEPVPGITAKESIVGFVITFEF